MREGGGESRRGGGTGTGEGGGAAGTGSIDLTFWENSIAQPWSSLLFFTSRGKMSWLTVLRQVEVPNGTREAEGEGPRSVPPASRWRRCMERTFARNAILFGLARRCFV